MKRRVEGRGAENGSPPLLSKVKLFPGGGNATDMVFPRGTKWRNVPLPKERTCFLK